MNSIVKATKAEWLKIKGLGLLLAGIVLGILAPLLMFVTRYFSNGMNIMRDAHISVFEDYTAESLGFYAKFFLLLFIIISSNRICQIDHKNGGWLLMETQPVSKFRLYLAKYLTLVLLTGASTLSFFVFSYAFAALWQLGFSTTEISWNFDIIWHLQTFLKMFISSLGISAFMLFISVVVSSYIWPFMIGIIGLLLNLFSAIRQEYYLFSPLFTEQLAFNKSNVRSLNTFLGFSEYLSLFWAALFIVVGYLWYSRKSFKRAFLFDKKTIGITAGILVIFGGLYYFITKPKQIHSADQIVQISGKITGPELPTNVKLIDSRFSNTVATIPVKDGHFEWRSTEKLAPGLYSLKSDNDKVNASLILAEGGKYDLEIFYDDYVATEFSRNNRKAEQEMMQRPIAPEILGYGLLYKEEPAKFYTEVENVWTKIPKRLDNFRTAENYGLGDYFKQFKLEMEAVQLLSIVNEFAKKGGDFKAPEHLLTTLNKLLEKPGELTLQNPLYIAYQLTNIQNASNTSDSLFADKLKNMESGQVRDQMISTHIAENMEQMTSEADREKLVNEFKDEISDARYKEVLENKLETLKKEKRGIPFPPIEMTDAQSKTVSLSSFDNKYIILEIWSADNESSLKLKPVFQQTADNARWYRNLAFISLNVDADKSKWQAYLSENPTEGKVKDLSLATTSSPANFNLNSLGSKYIVIDPSGNIYNFDAPKPGTAALKDLIGKIGSYE
jgi:hypothetical protein